MTDIDILKSLRERVLAASEMDRELDLALGLAIGGWQACDLPPYTDMVFVPEDRTYYPRHPGSMYPALTESIDAALALVERMLPGSRLRLSQHIAPFPHWDATLQWWEQSNGAPGESAPLAILAALLSALIAKEPT